MRRWIGLWLLSCVGAGFLADEAQAARRGFALIQTGEQVFEVGPLPESVASPDTEGWTAGYKCSVFGVFWAYAHWWDCTAVAVRDEMYSDEPSIVSAIEDRYTQADMQIGPWGRYGRFVLGAGLLVVLFTQLRGSD